MAYTELFFVDKLWPEVTKEDILHIFHEYGRRERRWWVSVVLKRYWSLRFTDHLICQTDMHVTGNIWYRLDQCINNISLLTPARWLQCFGAPGLVAENGGVSDCVNGTRGRNTTLVSMALEPMIACWSTCHSNGPAGDASLAPCPVEDGVEVDPLFSS